MVRDRDIARWRLRSQHLVVPRTRETVAGVALVDAEIVAAIRRTITKDHVEFNLRPYRALVPSEVEAMELAATRYGDYLRLEASLVLP